MGPTQKIISIFMLLMILILSIIVYNETSRNMKDVEFPPFVSNCPDFWKENSDGICRNKHNLGNTPVKFSVDPGNRDWEGAIGNCKKYKWANNHGLTWDGITNMDSCDI
jgi:hypothetical protein